MISFGLVARPRSIAGGEVPRHFLYLAEVCKVKELSIFIDESGDFGVYDHRSPFYIITMVFHDQEVDIGPAIAKLDAALAYMGLGDLCIHTGPIIRKEEIYQTMSLDERRRIFNKLVAFIRQIDIRYKCFYIEKKHCTDVVDATGRLAKQISLFIRDHYEVFCSFEAVKIYYDNGQVELSKMLSSVFHALLADPVFRRVMPADYKLFQVADLICSLELARLKLDNGLFSRSERIFFGNARDMKKNYIKPLRKKEWL